MTTVTHDRHLSPVPPVPATPSPDAITRAGRLLHEAGFLEADAPLFGLSPSRTAALASAMAAHADAGVRAVWEASR